MDGVFLLRSLINWHGLYLIFDPADNSYFLELISGAFREIFTCYRNRRYCPILSPPLLHLTPVSLNASNNFPRFLPASPRRFPAMAKKHIHKWQSTHP